MCSKNIVFGDARRLIMIDILRMTHSTNGIFRYRPISDNNRYRFRGYYPSQSASKVATTYTYISNTVKTLNKKK